SESQNEIETHEVTSQEEAIRFLQPEEILRHDASHMEVPEAISDRLQRSMETTPRPSLGWWRRWFRPKD
ncbi:MAG: hypothetical protein ACR2RV_28475, partial [Verrucomicrobiales bacterium]